MVFRALLFVIGLLVGAVFLNPAFAEDQQNEPEAEAIIVLDASGSMWGQIEGKNKIVIAREVIAEMLTTWPDNIALGLIAYGHHEEGNCADIQQVVPVSPAGASIIPGIVNTLNPKGKTPLTAAVEQAAGTLQNSDKPTSIILITDGLETCNADPCALGKKLAKAGIDMKVHVVGFDLGNADTSAIQCLANSTGGQYLTADNAEELSLALGQATGQVKSSVAHDVLKLYLSEDSEQFKGKTAGFKYFPVDAAGTRAGKYTDYGYGYEGYPKVAPGKYVAMVKLGGVLVDFPFEVKADEKQAHKVNLNAGILKTSARLEENSTAEVDTIAWQVFPLDAGGKPAARTIQFSYGPAGQYYLPVGRYRVTAKLGSASAFLDVAIEAAETVVEVLDLRAGKVHFSALLSENGSPAIGSLAWEAKPYNEATGEIGRNVAYSYGASGSYILSAGVYMLTVEFQGVAWQKPITIIAGEEINEVADLNAGVLSLDAVLSPSSSPLGGSHGWEIYLVNNDGSRGQRLTYGYGASFSSLLPAGIVEVEVETGAISRTEKIMVRASQTIAHTINLNGGRVNYNALAPNGTTLGENLGWDVYHLNPNGSTGGRAAYSYGANGSYLLPAGRFRITVDGDGLAGSADFELAAGEAKNIQVKTSPE